MIRPQSVEPPNHQMTQSQTFSHGSLGLNAYLISKSKLQDELIQTQREVRRREGELQKKLAVQEQKIMQLQETISTYEQREVQLKQMYDNILKALSGDQSSVQSSMLLMLDLTQNTKDQRIQELVQKFRNVFKPVTKDQQTQQVDQVDLGEKKQGVEGIKAQYEAQVQEMKAQIRDLKQIVLTKIDEHEDQQNLQMQEQLLNDNVQMHEIIELLTTKATQSETMIQDLQDQNECLKDQVQQKQTQSEQIILSLKQQLASSLKLAGEKSDEASRYQQKLEELKIRSAEIDRRRSILMPEDVNSTPTQKNTPMTQSVRSLQSPKAPFLGGALVTEAAPFELIQSHAKLYQKYLSSQQSPAFQQPSSSQSEARLFVPSHTSSEARLVTPDCVRNNAQSSKASEDGCILYGTISKQDINTVSRLERSPEIGIIVDQIVQELKKINHCSCQDKKTVVRCTHYHYGEVNQLNKDQIKQLIKQKDKSEERCNLLKNKVQGLKQQVEHIRNDQQQTTIKCQDLELRLRQAQKILQGDQDITPLIIHAKNVHQSEAQMMLQQSLSTERFYNSARILSPRQNNQPNVKMNQDNQQKQKIIQASTVASPTTSQDRPVPVLQLQDVLEIDTVKLFRSPIQSDRSSQIKTHRKGNRYEDLESELMLIRQEQSPKISDGVSPMVATEKIAKKNPVKSGKVPSMLMRATNK